MTAPNLGTLNLHAAGKVVGATAALSDGVNTVDVTHTGVGIFVLNLGTEIDASERHASIVARSGAGSIVQLDPAVQTDSTIGILCFTNAGAAADIDFDFSIVRTKI